MTREEFVRGYAKRSGWTTEQVLECYAPLPCSCGEKGCCGWQMVGRSSFAYFDSPKAAAEAYVTDEEAVAREMAQVSRS